VSHPSSHPILIVVKGTAVHLRLLPEVMRQAQCNGRHALTDRDWSSVQWQQLRPSHPDDFDDDVDFHDPVNPFIPSPADMGKPRAIEVGSMTLVPARYLTHGRLYTVYHGHLVISCTTSTSTLDSKSNSEADSNTSPTVVPVILKLVDCESFSEHPCPAGEGYTPKEALAAVVNEVRMYTGRLRKLQGVLVPRFYGAWMGCSNPWRIGSGPILIVALEDVGLGVGTEDLAEEDR